MSNDIKEINIRNNTGKQFLEVVYGDSCTGDTFILTPQGQTPIKLLFDYGDPLLENANGKDYVLSDEYIVNFDGTKEIISKIKYIIRHTTSKPRWVITDSYGHTVVVTGDHSMIIWNNGMKIIKPKDLAVGMKLINFEGKLSEVSKVYQDGCFNNEYVYDIEVDTTDDNLHNFFGNGILIHNTDSLYISYENLVDSIEGSENWTIEQKRDFIVKLNREFLDGHNKSFIKEYYDTRHVHSIHDFELETIALSGCFLDVKKRYAQILLWKDGKVFDMDKLPLKIKGLEMIKSSVPSAARNILKELVRYLLEDAGEGFLLQRLNVKMQEMKKRFYESADKDIESVCGNLKVNGYTKYILDDKNPNGLIVAPKCPPGPRALGNYNRMRQLNHLKGDPLYGGKIKWYVYQPLPGSKNREYFGFAGSDYPEWAPRYAPIDVGAMFQQFVLDPFNRILEAMKLGTLLSDGSIQMSLF